MIDATETTYLVADSTTMGKASLASLGVLSLIGYIITDSGIDEKHKQALKDNQIELIITS